MLLSSEGAFVLLASSFDAHVTGGLAEVALTQTYQSPFAIAVDATWLFPLPPDAIVRDMELDCGGRRTEADLLPRDEATERWTRAADAGTTAALLQQHRPDLFEVALSAVCPFETVAVHLTYVVPVDRDAGAYTLRFPTTIGPRYQAGDIPEPTWTTAPVRAVSASLTIAEGLPVGALWSDTHPFDVVLETVRSATLSLTDGEVEADAEVAFSWTLAGNEPRLSALAIPPRGTEAGYVSVLLEPRVLEAMGTAEPREIVFLIDRSGSMAGRPWEVAKSVVQVAIAGLRSVDTFNIVPFSNDAEPVFATSQSPTPRAVAAADRWVHGAGSYGGTELVPALERALTLPADPVRRRLILLVTDGYVGADDASIEVAEEHLGDTRIFTLGVGNAPNHYLLDSLATVGRGGAAYHPLDAVVAETVRRFHEKIAHPVAHDLTVDWGGLQVHDVFPHHLPDLFAGQPVRVSARWTGDAMSTGVTLRGTTSNGRFSVSHSLELIDAASHPALPVVWARSRIADLEDRYAHDPDALEAAARPVALAHHLLGPWTSLVAVESTPSPCGPGHAVFDVPAVMPEGMESPAVPAWSFGTGGLGGRSSGVGGGGTAEGLGGLGTKGSGYGSSGGSFGAKSAGGIGTVGGDPIILGALDRSLIDEVIKRHMNEIKYCYQRELTKNPRLAGKVVVKFTIANTGAVSSSEIKSTTMGNQLVGDCLTERFSKMVFPAPKGGGIVIVSYPFLFAPG